MSHEGIRQWSPGEDVMNRDVMFTHSASDARPIFTYSTAQNRASAELRDNVNPTEDSQYQYEFHEESDEDSPISKPQPSSPDQSYKLLTFRNGGMDVDSIPIQKDGMAVCEKCGAIGVKHAFYSKSKRFCSLPCSRSYALMEREGTPIPKPRPMFKFPLTKVKPFSKKETDLKSEAVVPTVTTMATTTTAALMPMAMSVLTSMPLSTPSRKPDSQLIVVERDLKNSFTWKPHLKLETFSAVPVSSFKHAPLFECWDHIMVGMKVEVENTDYGDLKDTFPHSYWVASVIKVAGYKALFRFEGFGQDGSQDFWLNLCKEDVQPVGWCASQKKPLIPPKLIQHKHNDWKAYLVKRLTGARTLPADFHEKVAASLASRFRTGMHLEVVDKNRICSTRVAVVDEVVGGRLHVHYAEADYGDEGFWCHERSPLIHPMNWSHSVGHEIFVTTDFLKQQDMQRGGRPVESEACWDMFPSLKNTTNPNLKFKEGMKLEAIDPLNLGTVCVATVTKVLKQNYLMIGIDGYNTDSGLDSFCHHTSSPTIFPAGFCALNGIELTPPRGSRGEFKWFDYLRVTKSRAAPVGLFNRELPEHGFKVGMKLEAVDLMEPRLICVATVAKVVGRLLCIHFDGWDSAYDQWCDCESSDLYPVGWCEVVGYPLEAPRTDDALDKKRKAKNKSNKNRKKRRNRGSSTAGTKVKTQGQRYDWQSEDDRSGTSDFHQTEHSSSPLLDRSTSASFHEANLSDTENIDIDGVLVEENPIGGDGGHPATTATTNTSITVNFTSSLDADAVQPQQRFTKTIPRLVDGGGGVTLTSHQSVITPELWSVFDVTQFLRINDCGSYCEGFTKKKIDGRKFLTLTKEQMVVLTGMKVGPSLKIHDLIQQLKAKVQVL